MAGMEGLGRLFDIVPISGSESDYVSMENCSAISFVCTGDDTFTLSEAQSAGGLNAQAPGLIIYDYWTNTSTNGTAEWVQHQPSPFLNAFTITSGTLIVCVFGDMLDAGYTYIQCHPSSGGLVAAVAHDLTVQRLPSNLKALSS